MLSQLTALVLILIAEACNDAVAVRRFWRRQARRLVAR